MITDGAAASGGSRPYSDIPGSSHDDPVLSEGGRQLSAAGMPGRTFTSALPNGRTRPNADLPSTAATPRRDRVPRIGIMRRAMRP